MALPRVAARILGQLGCGGALASISRPPLPSGLRALSSFVAGASGSRREEPSPLASAALVRTLSTLSREKKASLLRRAKDRRRKRVATPGLAASKQRNDNNLADPQDARRDSSLLRTEERDVSTDELCLDQSALIVTREIEMFNVFLGFEQRNKYTLRDRAGMVAGYVEEDGEGFGKVISRQLLRTRRPLSASVFDPRGAMLYRIRRPFYLISSTIVIEDPFGDVIGEVRQRWHLFKRNYDLYLAKFQFGEIKGNFLAWEFEITDERGGTLALIDRNFSGFGIELFTDAGRYVIHFGGRSGGDLGVAGGSDSIGHGGHGAIPQGSPQLSHWSNRNSSTRVTGMAKTRTNVAIADEEDHNIAVARPLTLAERAVTLAAVISIDFDYFSRHSGSHGVGGAPMPWFFPFPTIFGGGGEDAGDGGGGGGEMGDAGEGGSGLGEEGEGGSWLGDWDWDDFDLDD